MILENYLKIVDQAGVSATVGLWGKNYAEGNLGYLKSVAYGDHVGGTVRLIFPLNDKIAFTAEGGVNETMLSRGNDGRAVFGIQFGNMIRPKEYLAADHALPMEVPRVRYEVVTRRVRIGNDPPVANAGPDSERRRGGNRTTGWIGFLRSGRRSDHLPVDPGGRLAGHSGESHHLAAELLRPPPGKATASAWWSRTTMAARGKPACGFPPARRTGPRFCPSSPTPNQIIAGQAVTLSWKTHNADTANIAGIGNVAVNGSLTVSPTQTTTYTLTARNNVNDETSSVTVTVARCRRAECSSSGCTANPPSISAGQPSTLSWSSVNADTVSIDPGIGAVAKTGSVSVNPTQTTTYVVTATGGGASASCSITVTVGALPVISSFTATPSSINAGQSSTLQWSVQNADFGEHQLARDGFGQRNTAAFRPRPPPSTR